MISARYQEKLPDGRIRCRLCPHGCRLREGDSGICRVRKVIDCELRALNWAVISSAAVDPMEKKPLYHFMPGTPVLSFGTFGCSFRCTFCQNFNISQFDVSAEFNDISGGSFAPEEIARSAERSRIKSVAFTYSEPLVWFEFVLDAARHCKEAGIKVVLITNGYVEPEPFAELIPFVDAMNIDIKSMDDNFYRRYCTGRLAPVLRTCETAARSGIHLEITNLVIPGLNDSDRHFEELSVWVKDNIGADTPVHFSGYRPCYRMKIPSTPADTLKRAQRIAVRSLKHVYLGNVRIS